MSEFSTKSVSSISELSKMQDSMTDKWFAWDKAYTKKTNEYIAESGNHLKSEKEYTTYYKKIEQLRSEYIKMNDEYNKKKRALEEKLTKQIYG